MLAFVFINLYLFDSSWAQVLFSCILVVTMILKSENCSRRNTQNIVVGMCQHVNLEGWQIGLIGVPYFDEKSAKCIQAHYLAHDENFMSQETGQE